MWIKVVILLFVSLPIYSFNSFQHFVFCFTYCFIYFYLYYSFKILFFVFGSYSLTLGNNNVFVNNNNNNNNNTTTSSLNTSNYLNNNNNDRSSSLVSSSAASGSLRSLAPNKSTLFGGNTGGGVNSSSNSSTSPSASASPSPPTKSPLPAMKPHHGKPNFAPKPPGLQQLAIANGQRPAVARHHSMKSPRYKLST